MNDSTKPKTISELYPSHWLRAEDLQGRTFEIKIARVDIQELNGIQGKHLSVVLTLEGAKKPMALNKTQCLALAKITGSEIITDWEGRTIAIRPGVAQNGKPTIYIQAPAVKGGKVS